METSVAVPSASLRPGRRPLNTSGHAGRVFGIVEAEQVPDIVGALAGGGEARFQAVAAGAKVNVDERLRAETGGKTADGRSLTDRAEARSRRISEYS